MDELRGRAIELIKGQVALKRCRALMLLLVVFGFSAGFIVGATMPFQIKAVPIEEIHTK